MINIEAMKKAIDGKCLSLSYGEVHTIKEQLIISKGPVSQVGDICFVGESKIPCEVISLEKENVYLMPLDKMERLQIGERVITAKKEIKLPETELLLGRVLNGYGEFIDGKQKYRDKESILLDKDAPNPLGRKRIKRVMETGIKTIDGFLTIGEGQKIGIFAGTGVGKSTLLGMIAKNAKSDVNVIALIGERGREVLEFMEKELGEEGMKRSVLVVSTSDEKPLMRIKAALLATSIAEKFRDQGKKVTLMMDSVTRVAMARREIDTLSKQLPIEGKTPSMEPFLQRLLERAGNDEKGTITGIYTVLVERDNFNGAIPDMVRGILDGHIVLDRRLADQNHFPAINVLSSISRVMQDVVSKDHWVLSREIKKYYGLYKENEDEFKIGGIQEGEDIELDISKRMYPIITHFLKQDMNESFTYDETMQKLGGIVNGLRK